LIQYQIFVDWSGSPKNGRPMSNSEADLPNHSTTGYTPPSDKKWRETCQRGNAPPHTTMNKLFKSNIQQYYGINRRNIPKFWS